MKWFYIFFFIPLMSHAQIKLLWNEKTFTVQPDKITGLKTSNLLLLTSGNYNKYTSKKRYRSYTKGILLSVKEITSSSEMIFLHVQLLTAYTDTISKELYTIQNYSEEAKKQNIYLLRSLKPITKDTLLSFPLTEMREIQVKTNANTGGGFGILGLLLMGTALSGAGVVETIKEGFVGVYILGLGAGILGVASLMFKEVQSETNFKIGRNHWEIKKE